MLLEMINNRIEHFPGDIGIGYVDLKSGKKCYAGNCDVYPAAGLAKLLLLIEIFNQLNEGKITEDEKIKLADERYYRDEHAENEVNPIISYGIARYLDPSLKLTVRDVCTMMMVISDNTAFNILLDKAGIDKVNDTLYDIGMNKSRINRFMLFGKADREKEDDIVDNYVSVSELTALYEKMYNGQVISEDFSRRMLDLLKEHQRTNIIPYPIPDDISVAHQTGLDEGVVLDAGIIYSEEPFILAMGVKNADVRDAEAVMRDITTMCYENHGKQ